jgi:hypothetical protein
VNARNGSAPDTDEPVVEGRKARANENRPSSTPTQEPTQRPWVAVYGGQRCIGHILSRGKLGFEAFDAHDRWLGLHATQKLAANALSEREGGR